jgi:hypothetical protein
MSTMHAHRVWIDGAAHGIGGIRVLLITAPVHSRTSVTASGRSAASSQSPAIAVS